MALREYSQDYIESRALLRLVKEAQTLTGCIDKAFEVYAPRQLFGRGTAEVNEDGATVYNWTTFSEAGERCQLLSGSLRRTLPVGSSVALCSLHATTDHYLSAISAVRAGMICVSVSPTMGNEEILHILKKSNAAAVICQPALLTRFEEMCPECPNLRLLLPNSVMQLRAPQGSTGLIKSSGILSSWKRLTMQEFIDTDFKSRGVVPCPSPKSGETLFGLIFTSGSTGMPKGVYISAQRWLTETFIPGPRNTKVVVCAFTQPAWFMSQWTIWRCFFNGGKIGFSTASERLFVDMRGINPTVVFAPPAVWAPVVKSYQIESDAIKGLPSDQRTSALEKLKEKYQRMVGTQAHSVSVGSASVPSSVMVFLHEVFGQRSKVYDGYGTTEFGHLLKDGKICQRNVEVKISDVPELGYSGRDQPHPRGELLVRTPLMITEYVQSEEESQAAWNKEGWYRTGDIVEQIAEDKFKFVDRRKSFFKLPDGTFCAASCIEGALIRCPSVSQIFVCSTTQLCAAVVPTDDVCDMIKGGKDVMAVELSILEEFLSVGRGNGLEEGKIPTVVFIDQESWSTSNGLLGLSMKPIRPALMRKYEPLFVQKIEEISNRKEAVAEVDWVTSGVNSCSVSLLLPVLRREIYRLQGALAGGFIALHNVALSLRPRESTHMRLMIMKEGGGVTVKQRSSKFDPWGDILCAQVGSVPSSQQASIQEVNGGDNTPLVNLCAAEPLKNFLEEHEDEISLLSLHGDHHGLCAKVKVTVANCLESILIAAGVALANCLIDGTSVCEVRSIKQVFVHDRITEEDEVKIYASHDDCHPSCGVYSLVDGVLLAKLEDVEFEVDSELFVNQRASMEHCYEFLWHPAPALTSKAPFRRHLTLVTGPGPRATEVAAEMQRYLGQRHCSIMTDFPTSVPTDMMILTFLDEKDTMKGLKTGLQMAQIVSQSEKAVWFVTLGTQRPTASHMEHGGLWGIARSARAEFAQNVFAVVDVDSDLSSSYLANSLTEETQVADISPEVVITPKGRCVPHFSRLRYSDMIPMHIDESGVFVITGGTGSLGLLTARRLVEMGAAKIVLLSRTSRVREDAADAWKWLQDSSACISVRACDVTDASACKSTLLDIANELGGSVRGIVHAAGRADAAPLMRYSQELMHRTSFAKVMGALNLHEASIELNLNLQFFVVYSSVSVVFSPAAAGAVGYSAANAFLDSLAHHRRSLGLPCVSVQWGAWSEAGLAARHHGVVGMLERCGIQPVSSQLGLAGFQNLVGASTSQVMFVPMDWEVLANNSNQLQAPFLDFPLQDMQRPQQAHVSRESSGGTAFSRSWFDSTMRNVLGEDLPDNYFSSSWAALGLDSMSSVHVLQSIALAFGVTLNFEFFVINDTPEKAFQELVLQIGDEPTLTTDGKSVTPANKMLLDGQTVLNWFHAQVQLILGVQLCGDNFSTSWQSLGMDSMMSVHFLQTISNDLNLTVDLGFFAENDTPEKALRVLTMLSTGSTRVNTTHLRQPAELPEDLRKGQPQQAVNRVNFSVDWTQRDGFKFGEAPWDTNSLGMRSYVFDFPDITKVDNEILTKSLLDLKPVSGEKVHASTRIDISRLPQSQVLTTNGFYPVEVSCVAKRSLIGLCDLTSSLYDTDAIDFYPTSEKVDVDEVVSLVGPVFWHGPGRHFLDKNLSKEGAVTRYENWIRNGVINENILYVAKSKSAGRIIGFTLVAGQGKDADVSLLGFDPRFSPRGMGVVILQQALLCLKNMGFESASAKISMYDEGVVSMYQGLGFTFHSFSSVFHWCGGQ